MIGGREEKGHGFQVALALILSPLSIPSSHPFFNPLGAGIPLKIVE